MNLVARAKGILLKPKEEWTTIKEEPVSISGLFTSYALILAAIPAVAQFIGHSLIGLSRPYAGLARFGIGSAFFFGIIYYIFALVSVYIFGLIINLLAPSFSSKQNNINAMKLAVYSMTPAWVAGILYIIPILGFLVLIASIYGIYVLYLGFAAPLMDTPKEKVVTYLVVSVVIYIVLWFIVSLIIGSIFAVGAITRTIY